MGRMTFLLVLSITVTCTMAAKSCKERCEFACEKHKYCSCTQAEGKTSFTCVATTTTTSTNATSTADKYGCNRKCLACDASEHCECTSKGTFSCTAKCPSLCDIGAGKTQTCDEIIKATDNTCDTLTRHHNCNCNGCQLCRESNNVEASTTTSKTSIKLPVSIAETDPVVVKDGFVDNGNKWTKMKGFRCARDNRDQFWFQEWWYNSIIKHDHSSMEECQRFCESDIYCGACDFWPTRVSPSKYGSIRSFFLCDLRDQAPCDDLSNEEECSYVMILDRGEKTWSQKSRSCSTMAECDYYGKTVRAMHYDWYGIFQGGMIPLTPDSEDETYSCTRQLYKAAPAPQFVVSGGHTTPSTTTFPPDKDPGHCVEWTATEKDQVKMGTRHLEAEYGTCFCFQSPNFTPWLRVKASPHFCTQWSCAQTEVGVNTRGYGSNYGSTYTYYGRTSSTGYTAYRSYYRTWTSQREITNCACTVQSENKLFCMEWDCQENVDLQNTYHVSWDSFDSLETERYICKGTDKQDSVNEQEGRYCTKWTGNIVGRDEFELSDCRVTRQDKWGHPVNWACEEHGWSFWKRAWTGVFIPLIPAAALSFSLGQRMSRGSAGGAIVFLAIWASILTLISTMCAGLLGFLVVLSCYTPIVIVLIITARG